MVFGIYKDDYLKYQIFEAALYAIADVGGEIKVAMVIDPWGNAVGLIEGA